VPVNTALATVYARLGLRELEGGARARALFTRARHPLETGAEISMPKTDGKSIQGHRRAARRTRRTDARLDSLSHRESAGEAYRPCAEFIGDRLRARGFTVDYVRAAGTPGDNERYPRINSLPGAQRAPGPCVHFNSHIDVVQGGGGGLSIRSPRW